MVIYLGDAFPHSSSVLPGREFGGHPQTLPAWTCSGWGLPSIRVTPDLVSSYLAVPPLLYSGLLLYGPYRGSLPLGITQHPCPWSPDFPRHMPRPPVPLSSLKTIDSDMRISFLDNFPLISFPFRFCSIFQSLASPSYQKLSLRVVDLLPIYG